MFKILKCLKHILKIYITYIYVLRLWYVEKKKTFVLSSSLRIPDPLSSLGTRDFLSTYLEIDSLKTKGDIQQRI